MKKKLFNGYILLILSIIFFLLGLFIILYTFRDVVSNYYCLDSFRISRDGTSYNVGDKVCSCNKGVVLCVSKNSNDDDRLDDIKEEFLSKNLKFNYEYITLNISNEYNSLPLKTKFESVDVGNNRIKVILNSVQMCKKDLSVAPQFGMYKYENNTLTLQNNINTAPTIYNKQCLVKLIFDISSINIDTQNGFALVYVDQTGYFTTANMCIYNSVIYNSGDKFYSKDKCNICDCVNGSVVCTDMKCD